MKVTIWDLDYYYSPIKKNVFNPDVMKISSYHKQLGDSINFVVKEDDIFRPYELYYIIKEKNTTPNPPTKFYLDNNVRWWGKAVKLRINWKMNDIMLGCRPDYTLYPEHNTKLERAEHVRLFNNKAEPLQWVQDWTNTYKKKDIIITDPYFWCATTENIKKALKMLSGLEKVNFLEPIWIQKLIYDEELKQLFFSLKFKVGSQFLWSTVNLKQLADAFKFLQEFKAHYPQIGIDALHIDYRNREQSHWESKQQALDDFAQLRDACVQAKKMAIPIIIRMPSTRFETPYFELFEELADWTKYQFNYSWLEYITMKYEKCGREDLVNYWNHPEKWNEVFRDLLLQTYQYPEFIMIKWKETSLSPNDIPWNLWRKEFEYGI